MKSKEPEQAPEVKSEDLKQVAAAENEEPKQAPAVQSEELKQALEAQSEKLEQTAAATEALPAEEVTEDPESKPAEAPQLQEGGSLTLGGVTLNPAKRGRRQPFGNGRFRSSTGTAGELDQ